jgi:hypothetical protein
MKLNEEQMELVVRGSLCGVIAIGLFVLWYVT